MRRSSSRQLPVGSPQITAFEPEFQGSRRDPESRPAETHDQIREKMLDKTLADSFPTSDPPSTIPDPSAADSLGTDVKEERDQEGNRAA